MYSDLMYSQENQRFIQWMENLETYFQEHLFKNKDKWFDSSLELHDIENFFSSPLKSYRSGKYYLCRANIKNNLGKSSIKIFDEDENELTVESLTTENEINTILEIKGIRCTSSSFNVEIEIKQMMVLKPNNLFEKCLFTRNKKSLTEMADNTTQQPVEEGEVKVDNTEQQIPVVEDQLSVSEEPIIIEENVEEVKNLEEVESVVVADIEEDVEDVYQPELVEEEVMTSPDEVKETNKDSLEEIDFTLDEINEGESIQIKQRNDIHYEMYREAKRKAKMARDLALSSYLEAKRIKNTYMLENIEDSESSDLEMEELEQQEDE